MGIELVVGSSENVDSVANNGVGIACVSGNCMFGTIINGKSSKDSTPYTGQ